jgi:N-acetylglucosamine malate deacetylase 1
VSVLVVAPHPDDECLGAGGVIALLASAGQEVTVLTLAGHRPPLYPPGVYEQTVREAHEAHAVLGVRKSVFLDYPAVTLAEYPVAEVNSRVQRVFDETRPKIVLLPFPDRHVDHRIAFHAAVVAARPVRAGTGIEVVAMYETLSETHWNVPGAEPQFAPNWTVDITPVIDKKIAAYRQYASQVSKPPGPRSAEAVEALAVFRGSQASVGYGEAFQLVRARFSPVDLLGGPVDSLGGTVPASPRTPEGRLPGGPHDYRLASAHVRNKLGSPEGPP